MDPHAQWLRRYVAARVATRLMIEAVVIAALVCAVTAVVGLQPALILPVGFAAAQIHVVVRIAAALATNPINLRYLMGWDSRSRFLQPVSVGTAEQRSRIDGRFKDLDLDHLLTLGEPGGPGRPGESAEPAVGRREIYGSKSRLVIVAVDPGSGSPSDDGDDRAPAEPEEQLDEDLSDSCLTAISRLADGRLVVTTSEVVPPHAGVIMNRCPEVGVPDLLLSHVEMLDRLRQHGLRTVRCGAEAAIDQLHCEWEAWDRLGPFLGPFLAVDRRPQPHLLLVRLPDPLPERLMEEHSPLDVQRIVRYRFRRSWVDRPADRQPNSSGKPPSGSKPAVAGSGVEVFVDVPQTAPQTGSTAPSRRPRPVGAGR